MRTGSFVLTITCVLVAGNAGCQEQPAQAGGSQPPEAPAEHQEPAADLTGAKRVLSAYEVIRAQLAADEIAVVKTSATALHQAASKAVAGAPKNLQGYLRGVAAAAKVLSTADPANPDAVREAFGETSRHVVALLSAEPGLRNGLNIFECGMAQGYKKWVQRGTKLANPYMGKKMLECGSGSDWKS